MGVTRADPSTGSAEDLDGTADARGLRDAGVAREEGCPEMLIAAR
jgi:hypothetical protein